MISRGGLRFQGIAVNIYFMTDSRSALLSAAAAEFAKNGPRGTRIQDVVKAAGVNERMIYHHFGSKDGLYRAVMEDQRMRLGSAWLPVAEKAAALEPYEGMRAALGALFDVLVRQPQIAALFVHESLGDQPLAVPAGGTLGNLGPIGEMYERGQADGVFPADVPLALAYITAVTTLMAAVIFFPRAATIVLPGEPFELAEHRELLLDKVLHGMTGH